MSCLKSFDTSDSLLCLQVGGPFLKYNNSVIGQENEIDWFYFAGIKGILHGFVNQNAVLFFVQ